jgi:hypothetical protein
MNYRFRPIADVHHTLLPAVMRSELASDAVIFLGYHFDRTGISVANATLQRFIEKTARLYEQEKRDPEGPAVLGRYVRRWWAWALG